MLKCQYNSISLPKLGNSVDENEDNILVQSEIVFENSIRFAISDGATEASFTKEWSDVLVRGYKDMSFDNINLPETIKKLSENWQSKIPSIENMPWYVQKKAKKGAFATFLGLTINRVENSFDAIAVGDSALFQIRKDELIVSFPISSVENFNNRPHLIATNEKYQTDLEMNVHYRHGEIQPEDIFFLSTDALAKWFLIHSLSGSKIWKRLKNLLENKKNFEDWVNKRRKGNKYIKNDDVTLIMIKFE